MYHITSNEIDALDNRVRANFFNKLSGYKSPFLVGTKTDSLSNLSLFSNVFHIGSSERLIGMISRPDVVERHTIENIRKSKKYSLNFITQEMIDRAHHTSARFKKEQSEFSECGFQEHYYEGFSQPFVKESPLSLAMNMKEIIDLKVNNTHLIIGEVEEIFCINELEFMSFNLQEYSPVAVSGIDTYLQAAFLVKKEYAKP